MKKAFRYIKSNKIKTIAAIMIIAGIVFFVFRPEKEVERDIMTVVKTSVAQEISVTGRIEPSQEIELAVQSGGKVSAVNALVGQKVSAGQNLLRVNTADLEVRLAQEEASLEKARLVLAREEPKTNASDDLAKAYEDGFNSIADAFLDLPSIITGLDDILSHSYLSNNTIITSYPKRAKDFRDDSKRQYYAAENAYDDILKKYKAASRESDAATVESLIVETYEAVKIIADAVKTTNNFVDYVENKIDEENRSEEIIRDQADLDDFTSQTNEHLSALLAIKDIINDSHTGIKDEGYDIEGIKIDIRQAELDIENTKVEIGKRSIRAPISGVITGVEAEVGETISASSSVISLISSNQFQIEANLPESDVAKVKVGDQADVTLDAYGSEIIFKAKVVSINPSETLIDGVATYKTTFQFLDTDDRIKSGMTADITIQGERKENVLAVPQRAIIVRSGIKYVQVLEGETVVEKVVQTGLRGTDGNIEVTEGIKEGDKIVVFSEEK